MNRLIMLILTSVLVLTACNDGQEKEHKELKPKVEVKVNPEKKKVRRLLNKMIIKQKTKQKMLYLSHLKNKLQHTPLIKTSLNRIILILQSITILEIVLSMVEEVPDVQY